MPRSHERTSEEEALVVQIREPVRQFLTRVLRHPQDAEDATSITLMKVIQRYREGVRPRSPVAYALKVAWHRAMEQRRVRRPLPSEQIEPWEPHPDAARVSELRDWIQSGFRALGANDRAILHLRHVEDLSYKEISKIMDVPLGTVKRRIHEARNAFRDALSEGQPQRVPSFVLAVLPALSGKPTWALEHALLEGFTSRAGLWHWRLYGLLYSKGAAITAAALLLVGLTLWKPWSKSEPVREQEVASLGAAVLDPPWLDHAREAMTTAPFKSETPRSLVPRVKGVVRDPGGAPIPGARVLLYPDTHRGIIAESAPKTWNPALVESTTAADGTFELGPPDLHGFSNLFVSAEGFGPASFNYLSPGIEVQLRLERAVTLRGRVLAIDGTPIRGALVRWGGLLDLVRLQRETLTGSNGVFELTGLCVAPRHNDDEGDREFLEITANGWAPALHFDLPSPDPTGSMNFDVHLDRAVEIGGRIMDGATAAPIGGATVVLWSLGSEKDLHFGDGVRYAHPLRPWVTGRTLSAKDGTYSFPTAPALRQNAARLRHHALGPGAAAYVGAVAKDRPPVFRAYPEDRAGQRLVMDLSFPAAGAVTGRVIDDLGLPVPGLEVRAIEIQGSPSLNPWTCATPPPPEITAAFRAVTDEEGRFLLNRLPLGEGAGGSEVRLAAIPPHYRYGSDCPSVQVSARARKSVTAPDIVVPREEQVLVEVVDERGRAIADAEVTLFAMMTERSPSSNLGGERTDASGRATIVFPRRRLQSGYQATYRPIYYVPPPPLGGPTRIEHVFVRAPGHARTMSEAFSPQVDDPPLVRVTMQPERKLRGTVFFADGTPAPGVSVIIGHKDYEGMGREPIVESFAEERRLGHMLQYAWGTTNRRGQFHFEKLPPGPYRIATICWYEHRFVNLPDQECEDGVDEVTILLPNFGDESPKGSIMANVVDASSGEPIAGAVLHVVDEPFFCIRRDVGLGMFELLNLPLGTWRVHAEAPGHLPGGGDDVHIGQIGERSEVVIRLDAGLRVSGRVDLIGRAQDGWTTLTLVDTKRQESQSVPVSAGGFFSMPALRAESSYRVMVGVAQDPEGPVDWYTLPDGEALSIGSTKSGELLHLGVVPAGRVDFLIRGTALFYGNKDYPQHPEQRRLAAMSRMEVRDESGHVLWARRGLRSKHHALALPPGTYSVHFEVGTALFEVDLAFSVRAGKTSLIHLDVVIDDEQRDF